MKSLLVKFAIWILTKYGELPTKTVAVPVISYPPSYKSAMPYVSTAKELIAEQETPNTAASGEAKRHQVYAALIKQFPSASKRDLAKSIEIALD